MFVVCMPILTRVIVIIIIITTITIIIIIITTIVAHAAAASPDPAAAKRLCKKCNERKAIAKVTLEDGTQVSFGS